MVTGDMRYQFDSIDREHRRLWCQLAPGARVLAMLDAHELALAMIRGRLRQRFPDLSMRDLNLKLIEELARVERTHTRP
jgi:hypothetical protein